MTSCSACGGGGHGAAPWTDTVLWRPGVEHRVSWTAPPAGFVRSVGIRAGDHWRNGTLHLRRDPAGVWWLHRDRVDPAVDPVEHVLQDLPGGVAVVVLALAVLLATRT